ncbi:sugar ABC transporter ATP-binding protein [Achromobacter denitrificans]|jgi:simple sugar transport system ATP-binding protein|uniref:ATP-binding cassette domain-containing protein n=1 Tax=Achromobacter denitrificans TaxID=32002 RepID=A0A3R9MR99_ACHDE|nr:MULTISPECIES: ATP-binding cassette domain-containing protein [Achromobacter]ASC65302.1 ABC transporter ATP-binding protein [Achromobacter denitrificans]MBV2161480.1 ATP-binding cassette domain-containing protein [Achromobacter denitrificans]MDF3847210.1 ATP-binding cassette domain-containing protein [Achromobacter denitrificans]MDF3861946.1 ATP-binding cassette domain-containing protein [Achromobacter denitrificans]MDF3941099.1 ATP-binding cassette domain-containing protein [Achromobacter d
MSAALSLRQIRKSYGAVEALKGVDLDVPEGKVMAICGDNGAGKSTLIRIISGAQEPSGGELSLDGKKVVFASPHDALVQGIATIYQDLALAPRLSIWENIFMGAELVRRVGLFSVLDKRRMAQDARGYLQRLSVPIDDMDRPVERMSGGQRQAVAIARALRWDARVVIMDEPTAALGVKETALVLNLVRKLREEGRTVILISHNMADVVALADRVAILKSGAKVIERDVAGLDADALAHMVMTGRE